MAVTPQSCAAAYTPVTAPSRLHSLHCCPGSQLESGDLKAVSSTLSSGWVEEFQRATATLDASDSETAQAAAIFDGISGLKSSAGSGDLKGSKQKYVAVVAALEDWAKSTGLAANLKGL